MGNSRLNRIYKAMKNRCYNQNDREYKNYGGRGITVCDEWKNNSNSFYEWALNHGYRDDLTIDRIDNSKGYFAENCRWVSIKVQNNNKTNNHYITYKGKTQSLADWCNELHLNYNAVRSRINIYNWDVEKALETNYNTRLRYITFKGKTLSLKDWCKEFGIKYTTAHARLNRLGWTVEEVFEGRKW